MRKPRLRDRRPRQSEQSVGNTSENRYFVVAPAQDGTGYFVTRYDANGKFTAIVGAQHPGCNDAANFTVATQGNLERRLDAEDHG
jgi:hypothetical protein